MLGLVLLWLKNANINTNQKKSALQLMIATHAT
jgi:hypothetical protein